ncbi:MAG TPA: cupin domain-containing protein [Alphaproteobacteria bacterium]|nr:cupin domain-containing protein [Alphaproteobacteria bacterium]
MSEQLGTIDELPTEYLDALTGQDAMPLWPSLRGILPYDKPIHRTVPHVWRYEALRPLLLRAGDLTPMEKAERRVLMLANPGLDGEPFATASIFFGLQLILPGETAPNHRHSPSAVRLIIEGEGGFTTVEGERCPMTRGDVILTPARLWHEHEHRGDGPMVWLDALDAPLVVKMEAAYCIEGEPQNAGNRPDASQTRFRRAGLLPYDALDRAAEDYPQFRYPWVDVRQALLDMASGAGPGEPVQLAYVNPETGRECMPVLGFSALMLRPGEERALPRRSASCGYLVIEGTGESHIDAKTLSWSANDVLAAPTHAAISHRNVSSKTPAFLIQIDDAPMQRKLGFYEVFHNGG